MTRNREPHIGHSSISILNTRLSRSAQESGARGQYAAIPGEMGSWSRHQGCKLGEELYRLEDEVRRTVLERVFKLVDDRGLSGQPVKCERRSSNVPPETGCIGIAVPDDPADGVGRKRWRLTRTRPG